MAQIIAGLFFLLELKYSLMNFSIESRVSLPIILSPPTLVAAHLLPFGHRIYKKNNTVDQYLILAAL